MLSVLLAKATHCKFNGADRAAGARACSRVSMWCKFWTSAMTSPSLAGGAPPDRCPLAADHCEERPTQQGSTGFAWVWAERSQICALMAGRTESQSTSGGPSRCGRFGWRVRQASTILSNGLANPIERLGKRVRQSAQQAGRRWQACGRKQIKLQPATHLGGLGWHPHPVPALARSRPTVPLPPSYHSSLPSIGPLADASPRPIVETIALTAQVFSSICLSGSQRRAGGIANPERLEISLRRLLCPRFSLTKSMTAAGH